MMPSLHLGHGIDVELSGFVLEGKYTLGDTGFASVLSGIINGIRDAIAICFSLQRHPQ